MSVFHFEGFNICYADGHAKWNKQSIARKGCINVGGGTFALGTNAASVKASDNIYNPYRE